MDSVTMYYDYRQVAIKIWLKYELRIERSLGYASEYSK